jgi:hypothetical protein
MNRGPNALDAGEKLVEPAVSYTKEIARPYFNIELNALDWTFEMRIFKSMPIPPEDVDRQGQSVATIFYSQSQRTAMPVASYIHNDLDIPGSDPTKLTNPENIYQTLGSNAKFYCLNVAKILTQAQVGPQPEIGSMVLLYGDTRMCSR